MFERSEIQQLRKRVNEPRKFIQVIMGPRQVGKTTLVHQLMDSTAIPSHYAAADAVPAGNTSWLNQTWESARLKMKLENVKEYLLVIDEIQKISNWSETVKRLWDEDSNQKRNLKVFLLGSSRLLIQKGLTESLAGRFETTHLTHWTLDEMKNAFGWDPVTFAWFGGYPGTASLIEDESRWKTYIKDSLIESTMGRDIIQTTQIDKPALMKNLFELGCSYSGQILSLTKILGQLQGAGNTTTLSHYLHLLETAGMLSGIQKYSSAPFRRRASIPKFQVHNNALLTAQTGILKEEMPKHPTLWGRIIESAIGAYLINESVRSSFEVYYWRERDAEVDFVLKYGEKVIAVDVKSQVNAGQYKGMDTFRRLFNPAKTYYIDNQQLSWQEFLGTQPLQLF